MDSFKQEETELQQQLKQVCNYRGREMDLTQSAKIFNKLGLLYKTKSPDKISLIQSAALLNAAICRQKDNQKFQDDLHDLCKHVLICANAEQNLANLVDIAKRVATQIEEMRKNVRTQLKKVKKIPENLEDDKRISMEHMYIYKVKSLQLGLSREYKRIMAYVSQKCIKIMGPPPCKYALAGMGSLARNETTPYSDFEHILLLENLHQQTNSNESSHIKEYFRWYSVLFHIIVINLQETTLPNVSISCLNDTLKPGGDWFWDTKTPQGISFDSLKPLASKVPLGRQKTINKPWTTELIQSVDEMVKYVEADVDLKNGYKLGDILTCTCFVDGNEMIYDEFFHKVKLTVQRNQSNLPYCANIRKQLDEDLENFNLNERIFLFKARTNINIKRSIYRSVTLFMSTLGRLHDVDENSCFEIIDEFQRRDLINEATAHRLSHAVAVACHIRLFHYMSKKRQDDTIYKENDEERVKVLTEAVNKSCLIKGLTTTVTLQRMIKRRNAMRQLDRILCLENFSTHLMVFFYFTAWYKDGISFGERYLANQTTLKDHDLKGYYHLSQMYAATSQHDKCFALNRRVRKDIRNLTITAQDTLSNDYRPGLLLNEVYCLFYLGRFPEVMRETDALLKTNLHSDLLFDCWSYNVNSKMFLQKYHEVLSAFRDLKKMDLHSKHWNFVDTQVGLIRINATCLIRAGRRQQGLHLQREAANLMANNETTGVVRMISFLNNTSFT